MEEKSPKEVNEAKVRSEMNQHMLSSFFANSRPMLEFVCSLSTTDRQMLQELLVTADNALNSIVSQYGCKMSEAALNSLPFLMEDYTAQLIGPDIEEEEDPLPIE